MSLDVKAQFVVAGTPVGNVLSGVCPRDGAARTLTLSGDPGITPAQAQSAVLRVWVVDNDGGTDARIYGFTARAAEYRSGVRTRDRLNRGWGIRSV